MENPHGGDADLDLYTIPSYSSWFQWSNIHSVERISLTEFFDGSSIMRTPRVYKEYRDFIISKYREDPTRRLTFTHLRKSLVGDVSVLQKVFTFLEKWGLINFSGKASSSETAPAPASSSSLLSGDVEGDKEEDKWKVRIEEGAPHGVRVVAAPNSLKPVVPLPVNDGGELVDNGSRLPPLASYSDVYGELQEKMEKCYSCKEECTSRHYKYTKEGSFILCEKCFKNGNYEKNKVTEDFELVDSGNHEDVWTEAETLLLLESVVKHGDDWELVAQNVKTKSKLDCIAKLIQLPFGDLMLGSAKGRSRLGDINGDLSSVRQGQSASTCSQGTLEAEDQDDKLNKRQHSGDADDDKLNNRQHSGDADDDKLNKRQHSGDADDDKLNKRQRSGDADDEGPPSKRTCPTSILDASGSLLKQVAHICKAVGPHITASVGEAAISALCYENQCPREIFDEDDDVGDESESSPHIKNEQESTSLVENSDAVEQRGDSEMQTAPQQETVIPLTLRTRAATATALGAAAAHAKILADQEEREMEELVASIIESQLTKMRHKMRHLEDLELIMEKQHMQMEEVEDSLLAERMGVVQRLLSAGSSRLKDHPVQQSTTSVT